MEIDGEIIKQWLVEEKILKADVPDERVEWLYVVEFPPNSNQVSDVLKSVERDVVIVISGIVLAEKHYKALHALSPGKKRNLIFKWKMDLLFREAEFRMIPNDENLERIEFSIPIYPDELKKSVLMRALREILKCKLYVIWNAKHELDKGDIESMYL